MPGTWVRACSSGSASSISTASVRAAASSSERWDAVGAEQRPRDRHRGRAGSRLPVRGMQVVGESGRNRDPRSAQGQGPASQGSALAGEGAPPAGCLLTGWLHARIETGGGPGGRTAGIRRRLLRLIPARYRLAGAERRVFVARIRAHRPSRWPARRSKSGRLAGRGVRCTGVALGTNNRGTRYKPTIGAVPPRRLERLLQASEACALSTELRGRRVGGHGDASARRDRPACFA